MATPEAAAVLVVNAASAATEEGGEDRQEERAEDPLETTMDLLYSAVAEPPPVVPATAAPKTKPSPTPQPKAWKNGTWKNGTLLADSGEPSERGAVRSERWTTAEVTCGYEWKIIAWLNASTDHAR